MNIIALVLPTSWVAPLTTPSDVPDSPSWNAIYSSYYATYTSWYIDSFWYCPSLKYDMIFLRWYITTQTHFSLLGTICVQNAQNAVAGKYFTPLRDRVATLLKILNFLILSWNFIESLEKILFYPEFLKLSWIFFHPEKVMIFCMIFTYIRTRMPALW